MSRAPFHLPLGLAITIAAVAAACTGVIGAGDGSPASGGSDGRGGVTDGPAPNEQGFLPAQSRLRKLTRDQYLATILDLTGVAVAADAIEDDTERNGFAAIGASYSTISPRGVEQFETAALGIASQVLGDAAKRAAFVGCAPTAPTDNACTTKFLERFGRRAYRRPMTTEELARWATVAVDAQTKLGSFWEGLELAVAGILSSPNFLFRSELGEPDPDHPGWVRFTSWELASRLSFFLAGKAPDDALLDAAAAGGLSTLEGLEQQAERLLDRPEARTSLEAFFAELLHLRGIEGIARDPKTCPAMSPTLGASMRDEAIALFDEVVFTQQVDIRSLFDTKVAFVNGDLAKVYGLPAPSGPGLVKVTLPDGPRVGILGQAAFLTVNAHPTASSPTYRGKAIRERFLCESIPAPPNDVPPIPEAAPGERATARQRLDIHRKVEPCRGCHTLMDPIGLAFENFDAVGAFRTEENGQPIDVSGDLDGKPFPGPAELGALLRNDPRTGPCFARNLFRFASGHVEIASEEPAIAKINQDFAAGGHKLRALASAIVRSEAFRYATPLGETP